MRKRESVHRILSGDENIDAALVLKDSDVTDHTAVGEAKSDAVVGQVEIQRQLHQLQCVLARSPEQRKK